MLNHSYTKRDLELDVEGVGHIKFDISFGGSFFCILSADQLGLEVKPENASKLKEAGLKIRDASMRILKSNTQH